MARWLIVVASWLIIIGSAAAQQDVADYIRQHYARQDVRIAMRDGSKLYTSIYAPRDQTRRYPILMMRTPYGVGPYDASFRTNLGPSDHFAREGYIFVYQDVRGCYMSEGDFVNMRPHRPERTRPTDFDESTDSYDTIDWLVRNVANNNGKVGMWGISYPGFYVSAGMINAHPNLVAASPQAPIADWFFDDFYHHGAFFLPHAFNFFATFGPPRPEPTANRAFAFNHGTQDGYKFFLDIGSLKHVNARHFKNNIPFWNEIAAHPNYDEFWQARNILPHLRKVAPAVMTVGGWYDAEDLYGIMQTYRAVEKQNPGIFNVLVVGPWRHGGWKGDRGDSLGNIAFGQPTGDFFRENIQLPFFNHYLKGKGEHRLPEAYVFETGANRWRQFQKWPPTNATRHVYFHARGRLSPQPPTALDAFDEFRSDPQRPVPFTEAITPRMTNEYMTDDQRFASRRSDVLTFQTDVLTEDATIAGPVLADLYVSTTAGDADWVVKLIDVFPDDAVDFEGIKMTRPLAGYQMMVRSEVIRGRYRDSFSKPAPFRPGQLTRVKLTLQDSLHTFKKGHRIMVQVCSSWFPLVDRNPQKYVPNIFEADDDDFIPALHRVYRQQTAPSSLQLPLLSRGADW